MRRVAYRLPTAAHGVAIRLVVLLALACVAPAADAQDDCYSGFNCGRVAWMENIEGGANGYRLWTQDVDGSRRTAVLTFGPSNHNFASGLAFSPDSRKLYFAASAASSFDENIHSINADGSGLSNLSNDNCFNRDLALSRDGSRIVWVRNCGPFNTDGRVWLMDADGSNQRLLTSAPIVSNDPTGNPHEAPEFSPGGNSIVFTSRAATTGVQHVYLSSLDGLTVTALTNSVDDGTQNFNPVFTPDGRVIYASRRAEAPGSGEDDLYRINTDGSGRLRLTDMAGRKFQVSVNANGTRILFANDRLPDEFTDGTELYVANADGSGLIALHNDPQRYARFPRFSPDGTQIIFGLGWFDPDLPESTVVVNPDGTARVEYTDPTQGVRFAAFGRPDVDGDGVIDGADSCPAQPNGYRVAFASDRSGNVDVWTADYNGNAPLRVTTSSAVDSMPRFDATGSRIVFASSRLNNRNEIYSMNADGSGVLRLTNAAGNNITPAYSPDGSKITFIASRDGAQRNVWIMDADGANQIKLTVNQGFINTANNPVFNHDGTRIAFDSDRGQIGNANHDIFAIRPDGSDEVRLTTAPGRDTNPSYSRDGRRIVFVSFRDGEALNGEIYTMDADGSNQVRLTNGLFRETEPSFSPDGAQIVFRSDDDGTTQLYAMNRDGSGRRRITQAGTFNTNPTLAPQPDRDGDGVGDACDGSYDVATGTGSNVAVDGPGADVEFAGVTAAGSTSFVTITPPPGGLPAGYTLCETCAAFEISTSASVVPPITVCLDVPGSLSTATFQGLRLMHGENGNWVDRTAFRIDQPGLPRQVCGIVQSLSPFALASFRAPSSSAMTALPGYSRLDQGVTFTVQVDGGSSAPTSGSVDVTASSGESCTASTPLSSVGAVLTFACDIGFESHGPRDIVARFVNSSSHADSTAPTATHDVVRLVDVSVDAAVTAGGTIPGEATSYRVELRNTGPDEAPGTRIELAALPALVDQAWTCSATGTAVCPADNGIGDVDELVDLPTGSGLDFAISGTLPASLPDPPELGATASVDVADPNFVRDSAPANNTDVASGSATDAIFRSGFETP